MGEKEVVEEEIGVGVGGGRRSWSWMASLISISPRHSCVLRGYLVRLAFGFFLFFPPQHHVHNPALAQIPEEIETHTHTH